MWPDCSPPRDSPRASISSITYLSPTGQRTIPMPVSASAIWRPMLLITVATMAFPFNRPSRCSCRAHMSSTASPLTMSPAWSTKIARSPSPSKATPIAHFFSTTTLGQPLRVRGAAPQVDVAAVGVIANDHVVNPIERNRSGATVVVAPLAQSIASVMPRSAARSSTTARR